MNYRQTLAYFYQKLPMYSRVGEAAYKADLVNIKKLCSLLGNPQEQFPCIHIAGTNGKGSTSHMLAAILQTAGYRTGLYTSPHLLDFRERVRIDGVMIQKQEVTRFLDRNIQALAQISPSFFEMTVGLAFEHFDKKAVQVAVIETGLGGRLDSTNIINPLLSVITNIGWDHVNILGDGLDKIAFEKAGIIKNNVAVVVGEYQEEVDHIFMEAAERNHTVIRFASLEWQLEQWSKRGAYTSCRLKNLPSNTSFDYELDLGGHYQVKNLQTVLCAIDELKKLDFTIPDEAVYQGLRQVTKITGLQGRWQVLSQAPLTICDTGHNVDGLREVVEQIANIPYKHLHMVLGVVNDKDIVPMLKLLPKTAMYYFCKASIPRALDEKKLEESAFKEGLNGLSYPTVKEAIDAAKRMATEEDLIFIGGSTFVVAEALER